jgi:hypothetical protein
VYVGIYNHRADYHQGKLGMSGEVSAKIDIMLQADAKFAEAQNPASWVADLYDPFHDLSRLDSSEKQSYPDGEQFLYEIHMQSGRMQPPLEVNLFRDRLTLLHLRGVPGGEAVSLEFQGASVSITHVLSASLLAPKTLFDFDQIHLPDVDTHVRIQAASSNNAQSLWFAIFAGANGYATVRVQLVDFDTGIVADTSNAPISEVVAPVDDEDNGPVGSFIMAILLGVCVVVMMKSRGCRKLCERISWENFTESRFVQRVQAVIRSRSGQSHSSTAGLTGSDSMAGYAGSDVIDREVEEQYLHRGGHGGDDDL